MNWFEIKLIFDLCVVDISRLRVVLVLPILFGAILLLPCLEAPGATHESNSGPCRIGFLGDLEGLRERFSDPGFKVVTLQHRDPGVCMSKQEADIIICAPGELKASLLARVGPTNAARKGSLILNVCTDSSGRGSVERSASRVLDILYRYREDCLKKWLNAANLRQTWRLTWLREAEPAPVAVLSPVDLAHAPVRRRVHLARHVLISISSALGLLSCLTTCGFIRDEQRKGILPLLLIAPTAGESIVLGLFLFTVAYCAANVLVSLLVGSCCVSCIAPPEWSIPGTAVLTLFLVSLPMAIFSAACGMLLATFVRSDSWMYGSFMVNTVVQSMLSAVMYIPNHIKIDLLQVLPMSGLFVNLLDLLAGSEGNVLRLLCSALVTIVWAVLVLLLTVHRFNNGALLDRSEPKTAGEA